MVGMRSVCATLAALIGSLGVSVAYAEDSLADCWPDHKSGETLAEKLEPRTCGPTSMNGFRIERHFEQAADFDAIVMRTAIRPVKRQVQPLELPVLDLTFRLRPSQKEQPYEKLDYRNAEWYGSTFWSGPDWTRVGKDWHHPGDQAPSIRRFDFPCDGQVTVSGRVYKLHLAGDGIRASILHDGKEVWAGEIDGKDDQGIEPNLTLQVRQGESIRFVIHKRHAISCDTTHWDPVVTYSDGTRYQASSAFSTKQGNGGWYYEMPRLKQWSDGPPTIHLLTTDLSLIHTALTETPVELPQTGTLPFFVLADGPDKSGLIVAFEPQQLWKLRCQATDDGLLRLTLNSAATANAPDGSTEKVFAGPTCFLVPYTGAWNSGLAAIKQLMTADTAVKHLPGFRDRVQSAYAATTRNLQVPPDLEMFLAAQAEWRLDDEISESPESYATATAEHLDRIQALIERRSQDGASTTTFRDRWSELAERTAACDDDIRSWQQLYLQTRLLKRDVMLSDPLMRFESLLICKRVPPSWSHLVAQYFGWRQRPGGGLFALTAPGRSLECRDVLAGQLPSGSFLEPCLSFDAKRIVFSFVACDGRQPEPGELPINEQGPNERYYHIYEVNVDGSHLRQLTDGPYDDLMPAYLPDGGIAFCSTRRRSYSRCFGPEYSRRWDAYTIHRMDSDGGHIRILSLNDVNEWFPAVSNTGHLLFARWDYIDRDAVTHQNLWAMRPDGTNPIAVWGNAAAKPNCTFQAKSVPGSSKVVFIAAAHHAITGGPVCLIDPTIDANSQEAVTRVTPGPFPEAEGNKVSEYYESPWPFSEDRFMVAYSRNRLRFQGEHPRDPNPDNALGIYLLDTAGNRELIYRDPRISSTNPTPLAPRRTPPVLSSALASDVPVKHEPEGEMLVADVYQGLGDLPRGAIKELRIVEIFPKTTPLANSPLVGFAGEENTRAILGTVPVEADGSAYFRVPAGRPILFQALDADGFAYQTMRSTTYVQPGERTSCIGCHEHRMSAPTGRFPIAAGRRPSPIDPGELGGRPFSFVEVVQPVLDKHCVACHGGDRIDGDIDLTGQPHNGFTKSYWSLCGSHADWRDRVANPELSKGDLVPRFWQRNQIQFTPPGGEYGALGSRLIKLLREGHEDVRLTPDELGRIAAWIDMNAVFHGTYHPGEQ